MNPHSISQLRPDEDNRPSGPWSWVTTTLAFLLLVLLTAFAWSVVPHAQEAVKPAPKMDTPPVVAEVILLKGENALLAANGAKDRTEAAKQAYLLANAQFQAVKATSEATLDALTDDFEKAHAGWTIDWQAKKAIKKTATIKLDALPTDVLTLTLGRSR